MQWMMLLFMGLATLIITGCAQEITVVEGRFVKGDWGPIPTATPVPDEIRECTEGAEVPWADVFPGHEPKAKVLGPFEWEGKRWCSLGIGRPTEPGWIDKTGDIEDWVWSDWANYDSDQIVFIPIDED